MPDDVPRRPRLTSERRTKNAINARGSASGDGATRSAQPTRPQKPPVLYQAPPSSLFGRLTVWKTLDISGLSPGDSGALNANPWDGSEQDGDGSVTLASPDDGGLYLTSPGIYVATLFLAPRGLDSAASTCVFLASLFGVFPNVATCTARGGDPNGTISGFDGTASTTWYSDGTPGTSFDVNVRYAQFDAAVFRLDVMASVARIA